MLRITSIGLSLIFSSFLLQAQEVVFTTHIPTNKMGTDDAIQVRYEIQNAQNVDNFQLTNSNDFKIVGGPSEGQNFSMMNGEVSMNVSVTYAFQPKRAGKLTFPIAVARVKGNRIQSNVASIEVVKGSLARRQQPQQQPAWFDNDPFEEMMQMQRKLAQQRQRAMAQRQGNNQPSTQNPNPSPTPTGPPTNSNIVTKDNLKKNLFIRVAIDKNEVRVGEQISASYKLYTRYVPMSVQLTKLPNLNNFWTQDFEIPTPPKPVREILDGVEYQVFTIRKMALFPTQAGQLVLDAAEAEGDAYVVKPKRVKMKHPLAELFEDDPLFGGHSLFMDDPMFDDRYFNTYESEKIAVKLKSMPVYITVKEAPAENKPKEFKGAVGNFTLESKISAAEITTDDIATLTLTIRGNGNIKLIDPPKLKLPNTVEVFDPIESDTITNKKNNRITGYKTIKYRFNPQATGVLKIPSMTLSYYNADAERYEIKHTPEYTIVVRPGKARKGKHILPMDIHDIAAEHTQLSNDKSIALPEQAWYWGAYLIPAIGFLALLGFRRKEEEERKDAVRYKNRRANKVALSRLEKAEKHRKASEQTKFYEETSKAVWLYLSDKLNIPLATLSKEMAGTLLRRREISQNLIEDVFLITDECEIALYSPDAGDFKMNQIYSDSLKIIGTLEDKLG